MEAEVNIVDKHAFKRRLSSQKMTMESLKEQIAEAHKALAKELKKRMEKEPSDILEKVEKLSRSTQLEDLKRRLREQAQEASRRRREREKDLLGMAA